jgi:hypothetical protein
MSQADYDLNFSLDRLKKVYVSSCWRGFWAISDNPSCVTNVSGSSANFTIIAVKRVCWEDGRWVYATPGRPGQWWLKKAWDEAVALTGNEPWRVYELSAERVAKLLDEGNSIDDIRGFSNRHEPWQPIAVDAAGEKIGYERPIGAKVWERADGWRVVQDSDGQWVAIGSRCNAHKSILRHSPHHFDPLPETVFSHFAEAMALVDGHRPWN